MTDAAKSVDYEVRKAKAMERLQAAVDANAREGIGFNVVLGGYPQQLKPVLIYPDLKNYEEADPNRAEKRAALKKTAKGKSAGG